MSDSSHIYIAIDLKSFYASVECVERECDPLTTNLVVADESRTEKTICLAVSPSLKAYGIPGRARLFEVVQKVKQINKERRSRIAGGVFTGKSANAEELKKDPTLELTYIAAPPRMALYMEKSNQIYDIYLKYVAPEEKLPEADFYVLVCGGKWWEIDRTVNAAKILKSRGNVILLFNHMEKKARLKLPKVLSDIHYFFLPFFSNPFREDKAANTCYRDLWNDGTGETRWKRKKLSQRLRRSDAE